MVQTTRLNCFGVFNAVREAFLKLCDAKPGYAVSISSSGARPDVDDLQPFMHHDIGRTFFYARKGLCIYGAVINSMHSLHGASEAFREKRGLLSWVEAGGSLASLRDTVHDLKSHIEL